MAEGTCARGVVAGRSGSHMALMEGTPPLAAPLPYESMLRIMEALRLRVQDIDFGMKAVAVRSGKGDND